MENQTYGYYYDPASTELMYRIDENFKNLINFDRQLPQTFTLPYFIIEYICINCKTKLSQKLMGLCKYLRILQVRVGFAHIDYIIADNFPSHSDLMFDILFYGHRNFYRLRILDFSRISTEFKAIKINDQIALGCEKNETIDAFLLSLNLTNLKSLDIVTDDLSLPSNVVDHLFSDSLEYIKVFNFPNYSLELAFKKLKNLSHLKFFSKTEHTLETFKALINTNERKMKLGVFEISLLSFDIQAEEIFQFLDTHMESDGWFHLRYNRMEKVLSKEAEKLKSDIQTRMDARKQNQIPTCELVVKFTGKYLNFRELNFNQG